MERPLLNHHSAAVLPFHLDKSGQLHLIFEKRTSDYKPPFFDSAFTFIGGNSTSVDETPRQIGLRELQEEFGFEDEDPNALNQLLDQEFSEQTPRSFEAYDPDTLRRLKSLGQMFGQDLKYAGTFLVQIGPPILTDNMAYASTVFTRQLSEPEFRQFTELHDSLDAKLTLDCARWGNKITHTTLDEINLGNSKFAWGYDYQLNLMLDAGCLPDQDTRVLRPLGKPVQVTRMGSDKEDDSNPGNMTKADYRYKS